MSYRETQLKALRKSSFDHSLANVGRVSPHLGANSVYGSFSTSRHANSNLCRAKVPPGVVLHHHHERLACQAADDLSDSDRADAPPVWAQP